jgi:phage protein U
MYAILGDIKFEGYKGFSDFSGTNETVLSEHAVIEGKPRLQMTGEKLEEITLKFLLHSTFSNPEKDLEVLQEYRRTAQVIPFVSGDGYNYGDFVLKGINRTLTQTNNDGAIIGIEVELTLIEAVITGARKRGAIERLAVKMPAISVTPLMPKPSDPHQIAANLKVINTQSAAMDKELKDAQRVPSKTARAFRDAKNRIDKIRNSLEVIERVGDNTRDVVGIYDGMRGQAAAVRSQTEALAIFVEDGDINSAVQSSGQLRNIYGQLSVDAAPMNNLVGIRRNKENPVTDQGTTFDFSFDGTF